MKLRKILEAIGPTEPSNFGEICQGLGADCPSESSEWREFFAALNTAADKGLVKVTYMGNRIEAAILTEAGVAFLKENEDGTI